MGLPTKVLALSLVLTSSTALFSPTFTLTSVPPASAQTQVRADRSLQQVLIAQNKPEAALEVAQRDQGRALAELLASRKTSTPLRVAIAPPTIEQIKQIAQKQNATLVQYSIINEADKASELYIWVIQPTGDVGFRSVSLKSLNTSIADLVASSRESLGALRRSLSRKPTHSKASLTWRQFPYQRLTPLNTCNSYINFSSNRSPISYPLTQNPVLSLSRKVNCSWFPLLLCKMLTRSTYSGSQSNEV